MVIYAKMWLMCNSQVIDADMSCIRLSLYRVVKNGAVVHFLLDAVSCHKFEVVITFMLMLACVCDTVCVYVCVFVCLHGGKGIE